jgi:hypothetical protein
MRRRKQSGDTQHNPSEDYANDDIQGENVKPEHEFPPARSADNGTGIRLFCCVTVF